MPTDISVSAATVRRAPGRPWLAGPHGTDLPIHVVYDFTTFTHANFTTKGEIPNGTVLGKITASGKYGPYDPGATDGRQAAAAVAFNDNTIPVNTAAVVTDAALVHCGVRVASLPIKTGPGSLDANARTALKSVVFYG